MLKGTRLKIESSAFQCEKFSKYLENAGLQKEDSYLSHELIRRVEDPNTKEEICQLQIDKYSAIIIYSKHLDPVDWNKTSALWYYKNHLRCLNGCKLQSNNEYIFCDNCNFTVKIDFILGSLSIYEVNGMRQGFNYHYSGVSKKIEILDCENKIIISENLNNYSVDKILLLNNRLEKLKSFL